MSNQVLEITSHKGTYSVVFTNAIESIPVFDSSFFIIDKRVYSLHKDKLDSRIQADRSVFIDANEETKSLEHIPSIIRELLDKNFKRGQRLIAIGGGVTQDITCFIAATIFRGVNWQFFPTTLLAQADSCIGSKSSINLIGYKNIVGTFTPPERVTICTEFLNTLSPNDLRSGIGEILKIHLIAGEKHFTRLSDEYDKVLHNRQLLLDYLKDSLNLKKPFIESDEFDQNDRLVLNYGHTFGHAIEAATNFEFPHGIAVTIGLDMANFISAKLGLSNIDFFVNNHETLKKNFAGFNPMGVNFENFIKAFEKDKKHSKEGIRVILPDMKNQIKIFNLPFNEKFRSACKTYLFEASIT